MPHPAVTSSASKICVIAVPGSGKTTGILIPKTAAILSDDAVAPHQVLLLSFSRLSAVDLRRKVAALARSPRASTVHAFALGFLLSEDNHGIRNRIESILLDFQKDLLVSDLKLVFPSVHRRHLKKQLDEFSAGWATRPHDEVFEANDDQRRYKAAVLAWLREHEASMMEEIIFHAVELARQLPDPEYLRTPQYILVDEYQDLNRLEQEFIEALAQRSELLVVVGDPDQSIYGFKFAYPNGILDFAGRTDVEPHNSFVTYRCPRAVIQVANQLLIQASPARTTLLQPGDDVIDGETHFVRRTSQDEEFRYVLESIAARLRDGTLPTEIIVLTPRRQLCVDFVNYARAREREVGLPAGIQFAAIQKSDLTETAKERLLLLGLLAKPDSVLHIRSYLGLPDRYYFAIEVADLKSRFGGVRGVLADADPSQFRRSPRTRIVCDRAVALREFLRTHTGGQRVDTVLDELLPAGDDRTKAVRAVLERLREDGDTVATLYQKYIDYSRTIPEDAHTVRIMTLMASKGLQGEHVYILGCNAGNIPGKNRSVHMSDQEHKLEQLRLLYVGFTRATRSLTVSWSREIPFHQTQRHQTPAVRVRRRDGHAIGQVGICEFLQNLSGVRWE